MSIKNVEWEIKQEVPGMLRIIPGVFGRNPTIEEYKQKATELLGNGTSNTEMLLDETMNADIGETLLLKREFDEKKIVQNKKVHQIIFSYSNGDVMVNNKNIESVFATLLNPKRQEKVKERLEQNGIELDEIRI